MTSASQEIKKLISQTLLQLNALLHSVAHHNQKHYTLLAPEITAAAIDAMLQTVLKGKVTPDAYQAIYLLSERLRKTIAKMELPTHH